MLKERRSELTELTSYISSPNFSLFLNEIDKLSNAAYISLVEDGVEKHEYHVGYIAALKDVKNIKLRLKQKLNA